MKQYIRCWTAALLALLMAASMTACGKNGQEKTASLAFHTSPYYTQEGIPTAAETGELAGCCTDGVSIWYLVIPAEGASPVLCRVPLDGGTAEVLLEYQPPVEDGTPAVGHLGPFLGGDGTLWVWEQFIIQQYDLPEGFDLETGDKEEYFTGIKQAFHMRQLDSGTGKEQKAIDVTAAMETMDIMSMSGIAVDKTGTIFLADKKHISAIDSQGQILYSLKASLPGSFISGSSGGTLALLPDGTIGALTVQSGNKRTVQTIDPEAKDWTGQKYPMHSNVNEIFSGNSPCAFYYVASDTVFGVIPGEEVPLRLLPWSSAQLESPSSIRCFALLEEGQAVIFSSIHKPGTGRYDSLMQAARLLPTDSAPQDGKIRLTYGMIGENIFARQRVRSFNKNNKAYWIEVRDYAEGMLEEDENFDAVYQSALARLYAEITEGRSPDILDESIPLESLSRQGILEDLWPWIGNDPDLGREAVMEHVLECTEIDGKLTRVSGGFTIETAVASAEVAGNRTGWNMEEMLSAFNGEMPELYFSGKKWSRLMNATFNQIDKRSTLYNLISMDLDHYVNWETKECFFDGEDFKSLLQVSNKGTDSTNTFDRNDRWERGLYDEKADALEPCRIFPWEGKPILYKRTLSEPIDLVLDDVLFSGRDGLTDYEQRLWDADIIHTWTSASGAEITSPRYLLSAINCGFTAATSTIQSNEDAPDDEEPLAAGYVTGGANGNVYASFVGFPTESGTGSSFSLYDCVAISAGSPQKEGAWAFVRNLLLPNGNTILWDEEYMIPTVNGFSMNRETLEKQLAQKYWVDENGACYLDSNGMPVEYTEYALGVGNPGDIVLIAYLLPPTKAQLERFWDLYNAIDHVTGEDAGLLDIICEQAEPYFAGDKSLEETVKLIQNRANLYVNE